MRTAALGATAIAVAIGISGALAALNAASSIPLALLAVAALAGIASRGAVEADAAEADRIRAEWRRRRREGRGER